MPADKDIHFINVRRLQSILRKIAMRFCEDCSAFFARLQQSNKTTDYQTVINVKKSMKMYFHTILSHFLKK